jgi:hypothetical protein
MIQIHSAIPGAGLEFGYTILILPPVPRKAKRHEARVF